MNEKIAELKRDLSYYSIKKSNSYELFKEIISKLEELDNRLSSLESNVTRIGKKLGWESP